MKSKNIPEDIRAKSIKEAQNEIKEIVEKLENVETNLENSLEKYNRMMQLNNHIQDQFKKKAKEISKVVMKKNKKKKSRAPK
tara:strand:+ start:23 stop:268 length:246 start_codon:yes stop_codon:yes gene_type:complete